MIKINKMNKKGIFYSLSVMLFLIFLIIVFNNKAQVLKKDEEFHIDRAKIIVMDHFVRDFDRYYAQNIIETATRPALINLTRMAPSHFTKDQLVTLMAMGQISVGAVQININPLLITGENFNQSLATLSFKLDENNFSYTLERVWQSKYDTMKLNFHVNYSFSAFDTSWSKTDKDVNITIPVYGLWHPRYNKMIKDNWKENDTGCYINNIMSDLPGCDGMNIMPPTYCGDGIVQKPNSDGFNEECDGGDLGGGSCISEGFAGGGTLTCKPGCTYDTSGCLP